jgi:hypothetical protein
VVPLNRQPIQTGKVATDLPSDGERQLEALSGSSLEPHFEIIVVLDMFKDKVATMPLLQILYA